MEDQGHEHEIVVSFIPPRKWYHRAKWRLEKDYLSHNSKVRVPTGFVSDGATIWWALRWLFSPTGRYFGAAIIHDYVIIDEGDWHKANAEFEEEMNALSVASWIKKTMVGAVKLWTSFRGK